MSRTTPASTASSTPLAGPACPLNVMASGKLPLFRSYAERHPDTQLVVDHVGLITYNYPPIPDEPFADVPLVASLAELDHVAIKISAACTLSRTSPSRTLTSGSRCAACSTPSASSGACGARTGRAPSASSRTSRASTPFRVTGELSDSERSALMGGSLSKIYNWSPGASG